MDLCKLPLAFIIFELLLTLGLVQLLQCITHEHKHKLLHGRMRSLEMRALQCRKGPPRTNWSRTGVMVHFLWACSATQPRKRYTISFTDHFVYSTISSV